MIDSKDGLPELGGERGSHAESRAASASSGLMMRGAVVGTVLLFMGFVSYSFTGLKKTVVPPEKVAINKSAVFEPAPSPVVVPVPVAARPLVAAQPLVPEVPKGPDMLDAARRAPVVAFSKQTMRVGSGEGAGRTFAGDTEKPEDGGAFEKLLRPTHGDAARASLIGNRDYIIPMGTAIPCVLETALSSEEPGFSTCVLNRDVLSDNGRVVLLEKGTQVIGEYRGGLKRGQSRLFVLWTRAKTPTGVIIQLGSPATDGLGRAGFDGDVDNKWLERFGSALLLSVVSDLSAIGAQSLANSNIQAQNTGTAGKQAAAIAVEQGAAAVPTLNKHQGELVSIMVARDLNFEGVYKLRLVHVHPAHGDPIMGRPTVVGSGDVFSSHLLSLKE